MKPGTKFRFALENERPLQIVGVINAYCAILAKQARYRAIYLSGAGVANASYGMPDLGMTSLENVVTEINRITDACSLPLLVDADTGWGGVFNIARTVKQMAKAGAAAIHIEDQISQKRCGHRPNKVLVSKEEMCDRIKAATDARPYDDFLIMARTDALANEGMKATLERLKAYVKAGADMVFPEAFETIGDYRSLADEVFVPIMANVTEFGKTPLLDNDDLLRGGVDIALYPLTAFRAMNATALKVFKELREKRTQRDMLDLMQTRDELYESLNYKEYEAKLDSLYGNQANPDQEDQ